MADLMKDTYTYEELVNKYGNFHIPAVRLYVNGKEVSQEMNQNVINVELSLSLSAASTAVIRMDGLYDREKRSFSSEIKNKFKLGSIVEVGIGYGSEVTKLLKGYVTYLAAEFFDVPSLVITVMDVRRLMMQSGEHCVEHNVKNYSEAVNNILSGSPYNKLCKTEIDATNDNLTDPVKQTDTDYNFIANTLAASGRTGREFFVLADTAYFRKPRKETRPVLKMEYGRELMQFRMESGYSNLNIEVIGYKQEEQEEVTAKAAAKSKEPQSSLGSEVPVSYVVDAEADTTDKAKVKAEALADKQIRANQRASGACIGMPELVPGRFIEIVKLEEMVNKKYYITSVRHVLDKTFFKTQFEVGGWE